MRMTTRLTRLAAMIVSALWAGAALADVSDADLARPAGGDWLHANGSWDGTRFSTLNQIDASNVHDLRVGWAYSIGGETDAQVTPIVHDGLLFLPQGNAVHAVNAATGDRVWKYEWELPEDWGGQFIPFSTGKHRSVAIAGSNIYFLSNECTLIALNYRSGQEMFAHKVDRPYSRDFKMAADSNGYFCTVGPLAIPGQIIVPANAAGAGGLQGYVHGHDSETGEQLWAANMIPGPDEPGGDTWPGDSREYGGAGPWTVGSYDAELGMYFTGMANAYPWNPYTERAGAGGMANEAATAIVAVNVNSGEVVWRYTAVPGDPWDYDAPQTSPRLWFDDHPPGGRDQFSWLGGVTSPRPWFGQHPPNPQMGMASVGLYDMPQPPMLATIDDMRVVVQSNKPSFHYLAATTGEFLQVSPYIDHIKEVDPCCIKCQGGDFCKICPQYCHSKHRPAGPFVPPVATAGNIVISSYGGRLHIADTRGQEILYSFNTSGYLISSITYAVDGSQHITSVQENFGSSGLTLITFSLW